MLEYLWMPGKEGTTPFENNTFEKFSALLVFT